MRVGLSRSLVMEADEALEFGPSHTSRLAALP